MLNTKTLKKKSWMTSPLCTASIATFFTVIILVLRHLVQSRIQFTLTTSFFEIISFLIILFLLVSSAYLVGKIWLFNTIWVREKCKKPRIN
ncbi:hypothetical protein JXJ21_15865 [candidate division KSB1 bacterium]|nr:hypothetical protein [candidate division KSB1 bacterium]